MGTFDPFAYGQTSRSKDGKTITGSFALRAGTGLKLLNIEADETMTFITTTFEVEKGSEYWVEPKND